MCKYSFVITYSTDIEADNEYQAKQAAINKFLESHDISSFKTISIKNENVDWEGQDWA